MIMHSENLYAEIKVGGPEKNLFEATNSISTST